MKRWWMDEDDPTTKDGPSISRHAALAVRPVVEHYQTAHGQLHMEQKELKGYLDKFLMSWVYDMANFTPAKLCKDNKTIIEKKTLGW